MDFNVFGAGLFRFEVEMTIRAAPWAMVGMSHLMPFIVVFSHKTLATMRTRILQHVHLVVDCRPMFLYLRVNGETD